MSQTFSTSILQRLKSWQPSEWIELFVLVNLAFLGFDIFLAHSVNQFAHRAEWIPLILSIAAPILLLLGIATTGAFLPRFAPPHRSPAYFAGLVVGWASILVGIAGLIFHLDSQFFETQTLKNLVYTAPFAAPLAYTGLGLLLLLNRMVEPSSAEWAWWAILLTIGGFVGNFLLSLADHAGNGFASWTEWIPVAASALAVSFLLMPLLVTVDHRYIHICMALMLFEALVGMLGFILHIRADLAGPAADLRNNFLYGAPAFAPLLFANLAALALLSLQALDRATPNRHPTLQQFRPQ